MEIRRLTETDAPLAIEMVAAVKPERDRDGRLASLDHVKQLLADERNFCIGAFDAGQPVGMLLAHTFPCVDRDAVVVYLYDVYVLEDYRRRGIATEMAQLLKELCGALPVHEYWAGTAEDNIATQKLLERLGATAEPYHFVEYIYRPGNTR